MSVIKIQTGLRLDENTYEKIKFLAAQEHRSINNYVEHIIQKHLTKYETEHGVILSHQDEN